MEITEEQHPEKSTAGYISSCSHIELGDGYIITYLPCNKAVFQPVGTKERHIVDLMHTDDC